MQTTVEYKYSIGETLYAATLDEDEVHISKHRVTGIRLTAICNHLEGAPGWEFNNAKFKAAYTAVGDSDWDSNILFDEDRLWPTPKEALDNLMERIRKNAEKQRSYIDFYGK